MHGMPVGTPYTPAALSETAETCSEGFLLLVAACTLTDKSKGKSPRGQISRPVVMTMLCMLWEEHKWSTVDT
jgi:hypothetical protein